MAEVVLVMVVCFDGLSPGGGVSLLFLLCSVGGLHVFFCFLRFLGEDGESCLGTGDVGRGWVDMMTRSSSSGSSVRLMISMLFLV